MLQVGQDFDTMELVVSCTMDSPGECGHYFGDVLTSRGLCSAFNALPAGEVFSEAAAEELERLGLATGRDHDLFMLDEHK